MLHVDGDDEGKATQSDKCYDLRREECWWGLTRCWIGRGRGRGKRLVVRREHEGNVTASELLVDRREAVQLVLERSGVLGVEEALDQAAAVRGNTGALAGDLGGENKVLEDALVHSGERARVRSGLLVAVLAAGLAKDAALANEDDVTVRELLLELSGETVSTTQK